MRKYLKRAQNSIIRLLAMRRPSIPDWKLANELPSEPNISFSPGLLEGKKVLITGAEKNIGKSIAHIMAEHGAQIYFTDLNVKRCRRLENELLGKSAKNRGFVVDCSKRKELKKLLTILKNESIHIDILVNNVGVTPEIKPFKEIDNSEWQ